jgi:TonB family protein
MRRGSSGILLTITFIASGWLQAESPNPNKTASTIGSSSRKDVVHVIVQSESDLKQIFTYFPRPVLPNEHNIIKISGSGAYRLTVDPQGNVTEIKILKRMGAAGDSRADVAALKTFFAWRAKPGPTRIVDVSWASRVAPIFINRDSSHIPRR